MDNPTILKKYQSLEYTTKAYELLRSSGIKSNFKKINRYDLTRFDPLHMKLRHPSWLLFVDVNNKETAKKILKPLHVDIMKRKIPIIMIRTIVTGVVLFVIFEISKKTFNLGEDINIDIRDIFPFLNISTTSLLFALYILFELGIFIAKKISTVARIYLNDNPYQIRVFFLGFLLFVSIMLSIV